MKFLKASVGFMTLPWRIYVLVLIIIAMVWLERSNKRISENESRIIELEVIIEGRFPKSGPSYNLELGSSMWLNVDPSEVDTLWSGDGIVIHCR